MKIDVDILNTSDKVDLTPMIDIVFLLLIYFMVTTTLIRQEADLGIQLPTPNLEQPDPLDVPSEYVIEIFDDGQVYLDLQPFDSPNDHLMPQLTSTLTRLKQSSDLAQVKTLITIQSDDEARHGRVIDVLNSCAAAKIELISFGMGE